MNAESLLSKGILIFRFYFNTHLLIYSLIKIIFLSLIFIIEANISGKTLNATNADVEDTLKRNAGK